jgi:hypothetical protein
MVMVVEVVMVVMMGEVVMMMGEVVMVQVVMVMVEVLMVMVEVLMVMVEVVTMVMVEVVICRSHNDVLATGGLAAQSSNTHVHRMSKIPLMTSEITSAECLIRNMRVLFLHGMQISATLLEEFEVHLWAIRPFYEFTQCHASAHTLAHSPRVKSHVYFLPRLTNKSSHINSKNAHL